MKTSLNSPTKLEAERITKMLQLGCAACAFLGVPNIAETECHHMLDGNVRLGHWFTVPLCSGHHRGVWSQGQLEWMTAEQRVSIADGRKAFTRIYPTEWQLWDRVQFVMRLDNTQPISKIVPRRAYAEMASDTMDVASHHANQEPDAAERASPGAGICGEAL